MQLIQVNQESDPLFHLHVYQDHFSAKIYPNLGGSLQELNINSQQIIDGIRSDASGLKDYQATYKSSVLFPFPNRIEDGKYDFEGQTHQLDINEKPLNNAIHGLVYDKSFDVINTELNDEFAEVELSYISNGRLTGFPFPFALKLTYCFYHSGQVKIRFEAINTGTRKFPFGFGWHPYFKVDDMHSTCLQIAFGDHFEVNERMLPVNRKEADLQSSFTIGNQEFDDAFTMQEPVCVLDCGTYKLLMEFDSGEGSYFQIYTPDHRKNIALEPMTCLANSFNSLIGVQELDAKQQSIWNIVLKISSS